MITALLHPNLILRCDLEEAENLLLEIFERVGGGDDDFLVLTTLSGPRGGRHRRVRAERRRQAQRGKDLELWGEGEKKGLCKSL